MTARLGVVEGMQSPSARFVGIVLEYHVDSGKYWGTGGWKIG